MILFPESYLFGCGAKRVHDENDTTIFVCSFYPSLFENREHHSFKDEEECEEFCKPCYHSSSPKNCHNVHCISCMKCSKKSPIYGSLCGKRSFIFLLLAILGLAVEPVRYGSVLGSWASLVRFSSVQRQFSFWFSGSRF